MFDKLYIYNYFPTDIGEQETRTKQISTLKMAMIHAIMGEDTKALTSDEQLNAFFKERYRKELASSEELSWDTKYRRILDSVKIQTSIRRLWTFHTGLALAGMQKNLFRVSFYVARRATISSSSWDSMMT